MTRLLPRTDVRFPTPAIAIVAFAAVVAFAGPGARAESQSPGTGSGSSFSDPACKACERMLELCGPQLQLGLCMGRYVQCLEQNRCEADQTPGANGSRPSSASDLILHGQIRTD